MNIFKWNVAFVTILVSLLSLSSCSKDEEGGGSGVDVTTSQLMNYKWACSYTESDGETYAEKGTIYLYFGNNNRGLKIVKGTIVDADIVDTWKTGGTTDVTYSINGDKVSVSDDTGTSVFSYTGTSLTYVSGNAFMLGGDFTQRALTDTDKETVKYGCMTDDERYDFEYKIGHVTEYSSYDYNNQRYWLVTINLGSTSSDLYSRGITSLSAVHSVSSGDIQKKNKYEDTKSVTQTVSVTKGEQPDGYLDISVITSTSVSSLTISSKLSFYDSKKKITYNSPGTHEQTFTFKGGSSGTDTDNLTISSATGKVNGYEYVDLGLPSGKKWARYNIGTKTPTSVGNYYQWAATTTQSTYMFGNEYEKYVDDKGNYTKYWMVSGSYYDGKKTLESVDDAASVNWGSSWRMPTETEMQELVDKCTWVYNDTKKGFFVVGPNGNNIFLPIGGEKDDYPGAHAITYDCAYWTSSVDYTTTGTVQDRMETNCFAHCLIAYYSTSSKKNSIEVAQRMRYYGLNIRPIVK